MFRAGVFPKPLHFIESFAGMKYLSMTEKPALTRGLFSLKKERATRRDLHAISMLDWLHEKQQPARVIERFWRQILVSAINEELDRMAAVWGFQVFWLGFLASANAYEMGVPSVPLGQLYDASLWVDSEEEYKCICELPSSGSRRGHLC